MSDELLELADRALKTRKCDNELDVLIECALFEPDTIYRAARPNNAGTKVIYTEHEGRERTCWATDWARVDRRTVTAARLRARASHLRMEVE